MATETVVAAADLERGPAETGAPGSAGSDQRSLTQPETQKAEPQRSRAQESRAKAVAAERAYREQEERRDNQPLETPAERSQEPTTEADAEQSGEAPADPDVADDLQDAKGRMLVRAPRLKKLLAADARLKALESLAFEEAPAAPKADPMKEAEGRIKAAKEKIKAAKLDLDVDAEMDGIDELTDAKATWRSLQEVGKARTQDTQERATQEWDAQCRSAEKEHHAAREAIFAADCARCPDLLDRDSEIFRETAAILKGWHAARDPVQRAADNERLAVEIAARRLGMKLPPVAAPSAPQVASSVESKPAVTRTRVIHGPSREVPQNGTTIEDKFKNMTRDEKRDFLTRASKHFQPD